MEKIAAWLRSRLTLQLQKTAGPDKYLSNLSPGARKESMLFTYCNQDIVLFIFHSQFGFLPSENGQYVTPS